MNAVIIACHDYHNQDVVGKMLLPYNLQKIAQYPAEVDTIVFVGADMNFTNTSETIAGKTVKYINNVGPATINSNILAGINSLSSGDKFVTKDMDMMIYDYSFYSDVFNDLNNYTIVGMLDGNTHIMPTYDNAASKPNTVDANRDLMYNISAMQPCEYHRGYSRFAHWTFGTSYDYFKNIITDEQFLNVNTPDYEPMESLSRNIATNDPNVLIKPYLNYKNAPWCNVDCSAWIANSADTSVVGYNSPYNNDDMRCTNAAFASAKYFHISSFGSVLTQIAKLQNYTSNEASPFADKHCELILNYVCWAIVLLNKTYDAATANTYIQLFDVELLNKCGIGLNSAFFQMYLQQFNNFYRTQLL